MPALNAEYPRTSCTSSPIITVSVSITPPARNSETNVITRLRLSNTENGTIGCSAVRSTIRKAMKKIAEATPAPITHGIDPAARRALGEHEHRRRASQRRQQRPGDVQLEPFMVCFGQPHDGDGDDHDADRHVDQKRQPPGETVSAPPSTSPSTEPMPCIAADTAKARLRGWPTA